MNLIRISRITMLFSFIFISQILLAQGNSKDWNGSLNKIVKGNSINEISTQFKFTEGPAVNNNGDIFFTDQPNNKIWKYSTDGELTVFMDEAGRANGLYFDLDGNLLACADEKNELWSISPQGKVTVLLTNYNGYRFNGPNDLWIDLKSGIYFTDPYYQRDYWSHTKTELDGEKVYYLPKGAKKASVVEDQLLKPNGIIGTADGKHLFVADIKDNKTYKYDINNDGSISNRQLFANLGSDGMTLDHLGNLYLTGKGVTVFNKKGLLIGNIPVPVSWVGNISFGGKKNDILFITASNALYSLEMKVKGMR